MRGSEPSAQLRDESLQDGTAVGAWGGDECWWEQFDPSRGPGRGGAGLCLSALHPKVLCELLNLQEIFSVDCGTGGGQRAQHVRLQQDRRYMSLLVDIVFILNSPDTRLIDGLLRF